MLIAVPIIIWRLVQVKADLGMYFFVISTACILCAIPCAVYTINGHLRNFWQPPLQILVIRILLMVPVCKFHTF